MELGSYLVRVGWKPMLEYRLEPCATVEALRFRVSLAIKFFGNPMFQFARLTRITLGN